MLPAPTTVPAPIDTPGRTTTPATSQTSSPMLMGRADSQPARRGFDVERVRRRHQLNVGSDLDVGADGAACGVQGETPDVYEGACTDEDLVTVLALKRRPDHGTLAEAAQECVQDGELQLLVGRVCGVESL